MFPELCHSTVFRWRSVQIVVASLPPDSGKVSKEAMGNHLSFSTAFHPQSQGQVERVNQVLEDMLRACVISFGKKWEQSLPYAEFSYNNSYQASLKMEPCTSGTALWYLASSL
jgi:hypothetical protein